MRRLLLGALLALLLAPAVAQAAPDTIVNFNALATNTLVSDQYDSVGVLFGPPSSFGLPSPAGMCGTPQVRPGFSGQSAQMACVTGGSVEFPTRGFGTAFEFATERRAVSFDVQQQILDAPVKADATFYAAGGGVLQVQHLTLNRNQILHVAYDHGASNGGIADVVISETTEQLSYSDNGPIYLDNVDATLDDTPPPKKFSLALVTPSIDVVEGSTASATLSIRRFNGSNGNVTVNVGALPSGIRGVQVTPNPTAGKNPLTLKVNADSPFTGSKQLQISATGDANAGQAVSTTLTQTVVGQPALTLSTEQPTGPIRLVTGCGLQPVTDYASFRGDYSGYTSFYTKDKTGGLEAQSTGSPLQPAPNGNGSYPLKLSLDPHEGTGGSFVVHVDPYGATPAEHKLNWIADQVRVDSIAPTVSRSIQDGEQQATVVGNFPSGCAYTFRDAGGTTWPVAVHDLTNPTDGSRVQDIERLAVPANAAPGPLQVLAANGAVLATTPAFDVRNWRDTYAFQKQNSGDGAGGPFNWEDFQRVFGTDDTEDCFIACVRDPIAESHYRDYQKEVKGYGGLCFGWAVMAMRFSGFQSIVQRSSDYEAGVTRPWRLANFADGTPLKADVIRWFVSQHDKSFQEARKRAAGQSAADERATLRDLINNAGSALLLFFDKKGGHAVVAYAIRDKGDGGVVLSIANSNNPATPGEEVNPTQFTSDLTSSAITINADGSWSDPNEGWSGPNDKLMVMGQLPPTDATLTSSFGLGSLFSAGDGSQPAPAAVSQITVDGKGSLDGDGVPAPGTGVDIAPLLNGVAALPEYQLDPGKAYDLTITGTAAGSYEQSLDKDDAVASVDGVKTAPGQVDHVTLRPGQASVGFATDAPSTPATYAVAGRSGKGTRSATIDLTARKGGQDTTELSGSTLRLDHEGAPTSARITLATTGDGLPGSVVTAPIKLGKGQSIELKPRSWSALDGGLQLTLKDAKGHVVRRTGVRLVSSKTVKLAGLKAKRKGAKVIVTGRVVKPGTAPVLTVRIGKKATTLRGAQVKKGRFSIAVKGGRGPVTVQLVDEADGLATTRKTLAVKG